MTDDEYMQEFCKNVRRKGYVYADYIGETIN